MSTLDMGRLEGTFYDYMHRLGQASAECNSEILAFYVPMFTGRRRVLDVGCGEGQFLELLRNEDVEALGIDSDARMAELCLAKGLDVVQADLFDYLPEHNGQFDGVFSSNLLEHLSSKEAVQFIQACYGSLSENGILVIATPNPASLTVQLHEFWRDATHVRLYNRPLLEFLFHWAGFTEIESGEHPDTAWTPRPAMAKLPGVLAELGAELTREQPFPSLSAPAVIRPRLAPRRLAYTLRRRIARFLVRNVLYEEFASLRGTLQIQKRALKTQQDALQALHESHAESLIRPREIYARGTKPPVGLAEQA